MNRYRNYTFLWEAHTTTWGFCVMETAILARTPRIAKQQGLELIQREGGLDQEELQALKCMGLRRIEPIA